MSVSSTRCITTVWEIHVTHLNKVEVTPFYTSIAMLKSIKVFTNKMSQFWSTYMSQVVTCDRRGVTDAKMWHPSICDTSCDKVTEHVTFYTVLCWRGHFTVDLWLYCLSQCPDGSDEFSCPWLIQVLMLVILQWWWEGWRYIAVLISYLGTLQNSVLG